MLENGSLVRIFFIKIECGVSELCSELRALVTCGKSCSSQIVGPGHCDLKEQFSKLTPWNMYLPTVHFLQQRFVLVLSDLYEQKV